MILNEYVCMYSVDMCKNTSWRQKAVGARSRHQVSSSVLHNFHSHGPWSLQLWLGWPANEPQELLVYKVASLKCWGYRNVHQTQLLLEC